jgi:hypothetical protein
MIWYIFAFNIIIRCQVKILDRCKPCNMANVKLKLSYGTIITIPCVVVHAIYNGRNWKNENWNRVAGNFF